MSGVEMAISEVCRGGGVNSLREVTVLGEAMADGYKEIGDRRDGGCPGGFRRTSGGIKVMVRGLGNGSWVGGVLCMERKGDVVVPGCVKMELKVSYAELKVEGICHGLRESGQWGEGLSH